MCIRDSANISDPITNNTASFINEEATTFGGATPSTTCKTNVNSAIAGKGIGSNVTSINTSNSIIKLWYAGTVNPTGVVKFKRNIETSTLYTNHFFCENQKRIDEEITLYDSFMNLNLS